MLAVVLLFTSLSLAFALGIMAPLFEEVRAVNAMVPSDGGYFAAEAGVEDAVYRIKRGMTIGTSESVDINGATAVVAIETSGGNTTITADGTSRVYTRTVETTLETGSGASFFYGIQTDLGLNVNNNAAIHGNVYSNGLVHAQNNAYIYGDVVAAGPDGFFTGNATGTVYAHTIQNATIGKDAYYQVKTSSTVLGTSYPGSPDQPIIALPDLSETINGWEADALAGGAISSCSGGTYTVSGNVMLGPVKINCNLSVSNGKTVTLLGHVWVSGNITLNNNVTMRIDPSLGSASVAVIADNPQNRLTSSAINIQNNVVLEGTGVSPSTIVMVSRNEGGEDWTAVNYNNNGGDNEVVFYAPGAVTNFNNNASISAVTAFFANINNNTEVIYKSGLANLLFTGGPSGGYELESWKEVE